MDIVSSGPFTVASVVWQPAPHTFALTFVCRGTFRLAPHEVSIASQQDAPIDDDALGIEDPSRGVAPPSDLVPFKVRADVIVVGNVFAHRGLDPARALLARFKIGDVDKAVEVFGDRVPVSFGPTAWPLRRDLLGRHAATWPGARWMAEPLPSDFDPMFFNAAPRDQQLEALRDDEPILLENMHADHPRLSTALPGIRPVARVERRGASEEVGMRADTLWIDTTRAICAVTWRGRVMLDQPNEAGRVVVDVDVTRKRKPPESAPRAPRQRAEGSASTWETMAMDGSLSELRDAAEASRAALPFVSAPPAAAPAPVFAPPSPPVFSAPPAPVFAPPSPPVNAGFAPAPTFGPAPPVFAPPAPPFVPSLSSNTAFSPSPPALIRPVIAAPAIDTDADPEEPLPETPRRAKSVARDIVKIVYFDPAAPVRVRAEKAWRKALADLDLRLISEEESDVAAGPIPPDVKDRRRVHEVLLRGETIAPDGVKQAVEQSIREDGGFDPKLAILDAELDLPFDERAALEVYAALARPIAGGDKRLNEILELSDQLLSTPELRTSFGMAESLGAKLREAFAQAKRAVASDYLDTHAERMLLDQRAYQRRVLFDKKWIRSLARSSAGVTGALPVYLPEDLKDGLPMFRRFRARMLVELDMREDQGESSPWCARVLALGRVISPSA